MRARDRATAAMKDAGAAARVALDGFTHKAVDRILLTEGRVVSATDGKRLLAEPEATAQRIQRGVMIAVPAIRMFARVARFTPTPWVKVGSRSLSIGTSVHTGVRELQVLTALLTHRLEESTRGPADPRLVEKLAVDLYLHPKRTLDLSDDKLRLVRLTRKWVVVGALGWTTTKRAARALDAAERVDPAAASAQWAARQSRG
jgi:hypothetical protein